MATHGPPRGLGRNVWGPALKARELREELNQVAQGTEVLGVVAPEHTDPAPQGASASWTSPGGGGVMMDEAPPPWELTGIEDDSPSDARRYVDGPSNITFRWINPRLLESTGWRGWQAVLPQNETRFKLKVTSMLAIDGTVRRGGQTGDILGWMLTSWVESRRAILKQQTDRQTGQAVEQQARFVEEVRRGTYGPHTHIEGQPRHPTHTMAEGRSLVD